MATIIVPREYGYVIATVAGTFALGLWHAFRVPAFRKAAGLKLPKAYADTADIAAATPEKKKAMYLYNCAQRAHSNFLENHYTTAMAMLVSGLRYPLTTAALGAAWSVLRVIYAVGYTKADQEDGKGRMAGMSFSIAQLILYGLMAWTGIQLVI